jgi:hypothetical protein
LEFAQIHEKLLLLSRDLNQEFERFYNKPVELKEGQNRSLRFLEYFHLE